MAKQNNLAEKVVNHFSVYSLYVEPKILQETSEEKTSCKESFVKDRKGEYSKEY